MLLRWVRDLGRPSTPGVYEVRGSYVRVTELDIQRVEIFLREHVAAEAVLDAKPGKDARATRRLGKPIKSANGVVSSSDCVGGDVHVAHHHFLILAAVIAENQDLELRPQLLHGAFICGKAGVDLGTAPGTRRHQHGH